VDFDINIVYNITFILLIHIMFIQNTFFLGVNFEIHIEMYLADFF